VVARVPNGTVLFLKTSKKNYDATEAQIANKFVFLDLYVATRGVTRLGGARGKKQVWRPHVRN